MKINKTIKNIMESVSRDDCPGMAAEMAFNFTLSLFPFLISAIAIFGIFGTQSLINKILISLKSFAPAGVLELIENTLKGMIHPSSGGLFTISFITGLFIASNAIYALIKVLNKAYGVPETRPYWRVRLISILIILIFILAVLFVTNVVIMGNVIIAFLHSHFHFHDSLVNALIVAKWPVAFLTLSIIGFIIYYFMPNITTNLKSRLYGSVPGVIFFTVAWILVSRIFGFYVENISVFNKVYGTLGAFIVLLLWFYYTSLVILVGGEINSEFYRQIKNRK